MNTLTTSTSVVFHETNEGKTAGNAYSGNATNTSGTLTYRNIARGGDASNIAVECTSTNAWDYMSYRTFTSDTEIVVESWVYWTGSYIFMYTGTADGVDTGVYAYGHLITANRSFPLINGLDASWYNSLFLTTSNWYHFKYTINATEYKLTVFDSSENIIFEGNLGSNYTHPGTNCWGGIRFISTGTLAVDNWTIQSSNSVTIDGIVSGMSVVLEDSSGNQIDTRKATTTSLTLDTSKVVCPIESANIKVYGTDGSLLLTETGIDVSGGMIITYSGDTSTPSGGGGGLTVINGGIL